MSSGGEAMLMELNPLLSDYEARELERAQAPYREPSASEPGPVRERGQERE